MSRTTWILTGVCVIGVGLGAIGCESRRKTTSTSMDQNGSTASARDESGTRRDSGLFGDRRIRTDSRDTAYGRMERTSGGSAVTISGPFNANSAPPLQAPQGQSLNGTGMQNQSLQNQGMQNNAGGSSGSPSLQGGNSRSGSGAASGSGASTGTSGGTGGTGASGQSSGSGSSNTR